jgi:hypothetical protein
MKSPTWLSGRIFGVTSIIITMKGKCEWHLTLCPKAINPSILVKKAYEAVFYEKLLSLILLKQFLCKTP